MIKVFILAYDFPPLNTIGSKRPLSWYKYFKNNDLTPTVITRQWDNFITSPDQMKLRSVSTETKIEVTELGTIIRTPYIPNLQDRLSISERKSGLFRIYRKLITFVYTLFQYFIPLFDNKYGIYIEARNYILQNPPSIIIATGEPFVLFKHAKKLSEEFNIPWVADYRDGWTTNAHPNFTANLLLRLSNGIQRIIEKNIVKTASLITTAADEYKNELKKHFPSIKIETIYNGYFEEEYAIFNSIPQNTDTFTIGYLGTLYNHQPIEVFVEGVKLFIKKTNPKIKLIFFGTGFYDIEVKNHDPLFKDLSSYISFLPRTEMQMVIPEIKKSNLLLLLSNPNSNSLYAKIFDYLAINRKILLIKDDIGPLSRILLETESGFSCNSAEEVENCLTQLYAEWSENGQIYPSSCNIEKYTRRNQTQKLVEIITPLLSE